MDAKAVLLVDNDQGEGVESDGFGDEGMGSEDEIDVAPGNGGVEVGAFAFGQGAGEQGGADAGAFEEVGDGLVVLFGEDFGWCHHGGLVTMGDGVEHGDGGDDGFSGADIALDEPVGGGGCSNVPC